MDMLFNDNKCNQNLPELFGAFLLTLVRVCKYLTIDCFSTLNITGHTCCLQ